MTILYPARTIQYQQSAAVSGSLVRIIFHTVLFCKKVRAAWRRAALGRKESAMKRGGYEVNS